MARSTTPSKHRTPTAHDTFIREHKGFGLLTMVDVIKVSAKSRSTAVAGAIAGVVREHKRAEIQAIGAGAVNQAIKAAAIARGYLLDDGIDVVCIPYFTEVNIEDQERTALRLIVEPRHLPEGG
jgi:stage V sporulation protein S